jgi:hypothetical protein
MFPQLKDEDWKTDLTFLVDVLEDMNNLSLFLQGRDLLVHELDTAVQAFKTKLFMSLKTR